MKPNQNIVNQPLTKAMNAQLSPYPAKGIRQKAAWVWPLGIAAVALFMFGGVWIFLSSTRNDPGRGRLPAGQLQADVRTVFGALNYLLDHDDESVLPAATTGSPPGIFPIQPAPTASLCCLSNQAELLCEPITNQPARS